MFFYVFGGLLGAACGALWLFGGQLLPAVAH